MTLQFLLGRSGFHFAARGLAAPTRISPSTTTQQKQKHNHQGRHSPPRPSWQCRLGPKAHVCEHKAEIRGPQAVDVQVLPSIRQGLQIRGTKGRTEARSIGPEPADFECLARIALQPWDWVPDCKGKERLT